MNTPYRIANPISSSFTVALEDIYRIVSKMASVAVQSTRFSRAGIAYGLTRRLRASIRVADFRRGETPHTGQTMRRSWGQSHENRDSDGIGDPAPDPAIRSSIRVSCF